MSENEDEDIGYKKPPKASQWKPGQCGNPKGRPKKIKDFSKLLDLELGQPVQITINEQRNATKPAVILAIKDGKFTYQETVAP